MEKLNSNDLKFNYELLKLDKEIAKVKAEINERMDSYFIDEDKIIYDVMMKDYTGDKPKVYISEEGKIETTKPAGDFKLYTNAKDETNTLRLDQYKNPFIDRFKGFTTSKGNKYI